MLKIPKIPLSTKLNLESSRSREGIVGPDGEQVVQCLAAAIENKLVLSSASDPSDLRSQDADLHAECAIFQAPDSCCRGSAATSKRALTEISTCAGSTPGHSQREACGKGVEGMPREPPSQFEIQVFLLELLRAYRLPAEVAVIALVYLDRFSERSGEAVTKENWQRLTLIALITASKAWDEDSFDNAEFAQVSRGYDVSDINAFERVFLQCLGYDIVVTGAMYNKTHFLMETLKGQDADFSVPRLEGGRAVKLEETSLKRQTELLEYLERLDPQSPAISENSFRREQ